MASTSKAGPWLSKLTGKLDGLPSPILSEEHLQKYLLWRNSNKRPFRLTPKHPLTRVAIRYHNLTKAQSHGNYHIENNGGCNHDKAFGHFPDPESYCPTCTSYIHLAVIECIVLASTQANITVPNADESCPYSRAFNYARKDLIIWVNTVEKGASQENEKKAKDYLSLKRTWKVFTLHNAFEIVRHAVEEYSPPADQFPDPKESKMTEEWKKKVEEKAKAPRKVRFTVGTMDTTSRSPSSYNRACTTYSPGRHASALKGEEFTDTSWSSEPKMGLRQCKLYFGGTPLNLGVFSGPLFSHKNGEELLEIASCRYDQALRDATPQMRKQYTLALKNCDTIIVDLKTEDILLCETETVEKTCFCLKLSKVGVNLTSYPAPDVHREQQRV